MNSDWIAALKDHGAVVRAAGNTCEVQVTDMNQIDLSPVPRYMELHITDAGNLGSLLINNPQVPAALHIEGSSGLQKLILGPSPHAWRHRSRLRDTDRPTKLDVEVPSGELQYLELSNEFSLQLGTLPSLQVLSLENCWISTSSSSPLETKTLLLLGNMPVHVNGDIEANVTFVPSPAAGDLRPYQIDCRGKYAKLGLVATNSDSVFSPVWLALEGKATFSIGWITPDSTLDALGANALLLGKGYRRDPHRFGSVTSYVIHAYSDMTQRLPVLEAPNLDAGDVIEAESILRLQVLAIETLRLTVHSELVFPNFVRGASNWQPLRLRLDRNARVLAGSGDVFLDARKGAFISGASDDPVRLHGVGSVRNAELETVELSSLGPSDLRRLSMAQRVVPGFRPRTKRRPIEVGSSDDDQREEQDYSIHGLTPSDVRRLFKAQPVVPGLVGPSLRRWIQTRLAAPPSMSSGKEYAARHSAAFFWQTLAELTKDKHCPGSVQAEVRYRAARARRRAAAWGREKLLLAVYSIVGYGERVGRPILLFVAIAVVGGLRLQDAVRGATGMKWSHLESVVRAALLPFSIFSPISGVGVPGNNVGLLALAISIRVLGLVLIGFAVIAARKITRLE
jgi:hypothetical protein